MLIFGSTWLLLSPEFGVLEMRIALVGPCGSSPVQLGANSEFDLEGRCSIQLSYGRNLIIRTNYTQHDIPNSIIRYCNMVLLGSELVNPSAISLRCNAFIVDS